MASIEIAPPRLRTVFTVRGTDPVNIEVAGTLDAGAAVGFLAVADWFVGARRISLDLSDCDDLDEVGERAVARAIERVSAAGGAVTVVS